MAVGRGPRAVALRGSLRQVCERHAWVRVVLNFFDRNVAASDMDGYPQCVGTTAVPGFKTLFWKLVLTPSAVAGFSHVFLMDSDLDLASFEFGTFMHIANVTNTSVLSPSHTGASNAMYRGGMFARRCEHSSCRRCDMDPANDCAVCRQAVAEVKSPMFTALAWRVVHDEVLRNAPSELLIGEGMMDLIWCGLISHKLHGCEFPWMSEDGNTSNKVPSCLGDACAYSYVTPIQDMDDKIIEATRKAIEKSGATSLRGAALKSGARKRDPFEPMPYDNGPLSGWIRSFGHPKPLWGFHMYPTWRAPNTKLSKQPCWTAEQLGLGPYPRVPVPARNFSFTRRGSSPRGQTLQPARSLLPRTPQPARPPLRNLSVWSRSGPGGQLRGGLPHTRHFSALPSRKERAERGAKG